MKKGIPTLGGLRKTIKLIKDADIIQTWMYHADLLGTLACKLVKKKELIWDVHHSNLDKDKIKNCF